VISASRAGHSASRLLIAAIQILAAGFLRAMKIAVCSRDAWKAVTFIGSEHDTPPEAANHAARPDLFGSRRG